MEEISYAPLIDDMVWSYSRIKCYDDCPYRWYLQYIQEYPQTEKFFASYGKFVHGLIEAFYKGELTKEQMLTKYLCDFQAEVHGIRPKTETLRRYIDGGADYLRGFAPFPYKVLAVEERLKFEILGYMFVGFADYIGLDESDGGIVLSDHKARDLKPRSNRARPTKNDETLDTILRQLYLYCDPIKERYGAFPKEMLLNCYRTGVTIKEPFCKEKHEEAKRWAVEQIQKIRNDSAFYPETNPFSCFWICPVSEYCEFR